MSEPFPVEARFGSDGTLIPLSFEWQGQRYSVESYGRQWEEEGRQHFLVMVSGDLVFELVYLQEDNQWQVARSPHDFNKYANI